MWIMNNGKHFDSDKIPYIRDQLSRLPEQTLSNLYSLQFKDPTTITVVSALAGALGIDRFMLGDVGLGVAKLLLAGGCGVWWLVDIFLVGARAKELNFQSLMQAITAYSQPYTPYPPQQPPPPPNM